MNQTCFHHDDLDDLCSSSKFLSRRFFPDCDFLKAFDLRDSKDGPFVHLAKVMKLPLPVFTKYWLKSAQNTLSEGDYLERNKWFRKEFFREDDRELKLIDDEIITLDDQISM